jgi:hypothetical protein
MRLKKKLTATYNRFKRQRTSVKWPAGAPSKNGAEIRNRRAASKILTRHVAGVAPLPKALQHQLYAGPTRRVRAIWTARCLRTEAANCGIYHPWRKAGPHESARIDPGGRTQFAELDGGSWDGRRGCGSGLTRAHRPPRKRKTAEGRSFAVRLRRSSRSDDGDRCAAAAPEAGVAQAGDARQHHRPGRRFGNPSA